MDTEMDPLLKGLTEKKQSFRRNVVLLAAELKEVRSRLNSQQLSFARESITRQEAEIRAKKTEEEMKRLQKSLQEKNGQLEASAASANMYLKELDVLRSQLSATQTTANASYAANQSAKLQYFALVKELDERNCSLREHETHMTKLCEQLDHLQEDLQARECFQKRLKEMLRIEYDIMEALAKVGVNKELEFRKVVDEVTLERINKLLVAKDEEIIKLKDEITRMSANWTLKSKELEFQIEKHHKADQELKKKVSKLEFYLQEACVQTRKLQRMGERRDEILKELKDQLATNQAPVNTAKESFWETLGFKIVASMSMLILVFISRR